VLTALLWSLLESKRKEESSGNVRTVLSSRQIKNIITSPPSISTATTSPSTTTSSSPTIKKFKLEKEQTIKANPGLRDAYWEVSYLLKKCERELETLKKNGVSEAERAVVEAMFDAVESSVEVVEGGIEEVKGMDVWVGVFGFV